MIQEPIQEKYNIESFQIIKFLMGDEKTEYVKLQWVQIIEKRELWLETQKEILIGRIEHDFPSVDFTVNIMGYLQALPIILSLLTMILFCAEIIPVRQRGIEVFQIHRLPIFFGVRI